MTHSTECNVRVLRDADEVSRVAADEITRRANQVVRERGKFTVALSGGSTPKVLYTLLANSDAPYREQMPWGFTHFFFGDERHVPPDHAQSNYCMAREAMLSEVPVPAENVHRVTGENPDARVAADDYERVLRDFFGTQPGAVPRFDLILLGVGADGHTASLFPGTPALVEQSRFFVANWVKKSGSHRLTLTLPVINNAHAVMFLVAGKEKADVLRSVLEVEHDDSSARFPARLVHPVDGELLWLVDEAAAIQLRFEALVGRVRAEAM
ncbi:MAG: 6-phosphogluconolactonase [Pyrinomonadaceae bacterium]